MPTTTFHSDSNVLITGVTGLIGGEILRRLRSCGHAGRVWPLVRAADAAAAAGRVADRLTRSRGDEPPTRGETAVAGDVLAADWGMRPAVADLVRDRVDVIVHNAADTSFVAHRGTGTANVDGVRRLIAFARSCRRPPLVAYMSTASNVGDVTGCCVTEPDGCRAGNHHFNEYTHSKAVAEDLLRASGLPVLTLRPTIVLSAGLPDAAFARQILWCVPLTRAFRALPVDPAARMDIVDAGFVADATLRLLAHPARSFDCYHLSAGPAAAVTLGELTAAADRLYGRKRPLMLVPPGAWTADHAARYVRTAVQRKVFRSLRHYLPFLNMDVVYDNARLRRDLGPAAAPRPVDDYYDALLRLIPTKAALREAAVP